MEVGNTKKILMQYKVNAQDITDIILGLSFGVVFEIIAFALIHASIFGI